MKFNKWYGLLAFVLLLVEILIAAFMHDAFVRPFVGDFLVVILLYCVLMTVVEMPLWPAAIGVLVFSYAVETAQYFRIVEVLGLQQYRIANIVIGTTFQWGDILAYTLGMALVVWVEKARGK